MTRRCTSPERTTPADENAGHVGIYIGKGQIISNIGGTVIDTVEGWTAYYGFGGWGWGGAVVPQK